MSNPALARIMEMAERWLPVPGFEGIYEASDQGRIRSVDRVDSAGRNLKGRVLKPSLGSSDGYGHESGGYRRLIVHLSWAGKSHTRFVHQVVLETFVGPRPSPAHITRHLNGQADDNRLSNLTWGTARQNSADALEHGTNRESRKTHCLRGHEYTPENTLLRKDGRHRTCRTCKRARRRGVT